MIFDRVKQVDYLSLPTHELTGHDTVTVDLSGLKFIKPLGVISILLLIESISKLPSAGQLTVNIIGPGSYDVLDYLLKIDLLNALRSMINLKIPDELVPSNREILPVIPITRFQKYQDVEDIAHAMQEVFHTELMGLTTLHQPCHSIFSELAHNSVEHAHSDGGFVLAQQYNFRKGKIIEIAVGDCGIGISKSLLQNPRIKGLFNTDEEAIKLVLDGGHSRIIDDTHRGYGLNHLRDDEVTPIRTRKLTLRSGTGYANIWNGGQIYSSQCKYFPGTLGYAVIPCG